MALLKCPQKQVRNQQNPLLMTQHPKVSEDDLLSVWEHIAAFRKVLLYIIGFFLVCVSVVHYFRNELIGFLLHPLGKTISALQFLSPLDPLYFILKIDFIFGVILCLPITTILLWRYVSPAVTIVWWQIMLVFTASMLLSITAGGYSYMVVVPLILKFMNSIVIPGTVIAFTAQGYLNFILSTTIILVAIFQIPLFLMATISMNIIQPTMITKNRSSVYLAIIVACAIITPTTDILTLILVTAPCIITTELGLVLGVWVKNKRIFLKSNTRI